MLSLSCALGSCRRTIVDGRKEGQMDEWVGKWAGIPPGCVRQADR